MRTIAIVNQKGGCGKTTISINLADAIAKTGKKTLLIDMDPQSHCAVGLAVPEEQIEQSIYDVLISKSRNEPVRLAEILWQINDLLALAPASIDLTAFEQQMAGIPQKEDCLKTILKDINGEYDYVIVDCPPAVGLLTFNAIKAATDAVIPVETGYFALHGLSKQLETLSILCGRCNQQVSVKVLASMYDIRTKMAREVLAELRNHFADKMFKTIINFNTKIKEAASLGQPIGEYDPASKGQRDFKMLADEVIGSMAEDNRHQFVNSLADQLESISVTADELVKTARTPIRTTSSRTKADQSNPFDTDTKLSDYYGVNRINDAVVFVSLYPRAETVQIAGDFNGWKPAETPMTKVGESGVWKASLKLPAGKYRYRLVVDGKWQQDPYNEITEPNPFGDLNSVLEVK